MRCLGQGREKCSPAAIFSPMKWSVGVWQFPHLWSLVRLRVKAEQNGGDPCNQNRPLCSRTMMWQVHMPAAWHVRIRWHSSCHRSFYCWRLLSLAIPKYSVTAFLWRLQLFYVCNVALLWLISLMQCKKHFYLVALNWLPLDGATAASVLTTWHCYSSLHLLTDL